MRGQFAALAAIAAALFLPSLAQAAPPPNDAFVAAETLSGSSGTVYGTTVDPTTEAGEPPSMPRNHSIWYAWTAAGYGTFSFNTGGTTYAWIFTGDAFGALDMKINGQSYGFVSVRPGVTYRIALDDWLSGGPTQLTWSFQELPPPPPNDDWANAQLLSGTGGTVQLDTLSATREACDSAYGFRAPVWYSWTAPTDGALTVAADSSTRGTIVAVFTGATACSLVERTRSGGDPSYADVVAGETYWIGVDTWTEGGPTSFSWSFATVTRPANDNFANATPLGPAYRGSVTGTTVYATSEPGEWTPFFGRTVWYAWTPAESGTASINVQLANVVVYSGEALGSLATVAYGNSMFAVKSGVTYHVQVAGGDSFTLEWPLEAAGGGGGGTTGSPPTAAPDAFTTDEDNALALTAADLLANDSDPDGDAFHLAGISTDKKSHGTVKLGKSGIVFTPQADFNGTAHFTYRVADATGLDAVGLVSVEVFPVNDAPTVTLVADASEVAEGAPLALRAQAEDADGDQLVYDWTATAGELTGGGADNTLVVDDGPASVTVQLFVSDGVASADATYEVVVKNVAPKVEVQPASGVWGLPITVTGSATDPSAADTAAGLSPSWAIGGAAVAALTASHVFDASGSYPATLTVTDKDGDSGSQEIAVEVQKRGATLSYAGDSTAPFGFGSVGARFADAVDAGTARVDARALTFTVGGTTFAASTAGGVATAAVGASLLPGTYAVEAKFGGDDLYLATNAGGSLTVTNSAGKVTGDVVLGDGTSVSFAVAGDGTAVRGSLTAGGFTASRLAALGISAHAAWFAGTGDDGRAFVAYVEDNGEPGRGVDVFRLWLAGEAHVGSGVIAAGNVQLHR